MTLKGKVLIFNQINFKQADIKNRDGTDIDKESLIKQLEAFHFECISHDDKTKDQILNYILEYEVVNNIELSDKILIVVVLTHGAAGATYWAYDTTYSEEEILSKLCCDKLQHVRKLIIFQACRRGDAAPVAPDALYSLRNTRNTIIAHSTSQGTDSIRNNIRGSRFIQAIVHELIRTKNDTLQNVLERASNRVARKSDGAQTPQIISRAELRYDDAFLIARVNFCDLRLRRGAVDAVRYDSIDYRTAFDYRDRLLDYVKTRQSLDVSVISRVDEANDLLDLFDECYFKSRHIGLSDVVDRMRTFLIQVAL